ncbi:hypothetical protein [Flavobacterium sp. GCM10027622]|uniref:hypothetical protein n=1 Tax=unclassified Flavobacterium TaxID=196869 RepID=UPI00361C06A3
MHNKLSDSKVNVRGQLSVNIPVALIICFSLVVFSMFMQYRIAVLLGSAIGWLYWKYATPKWIKWAHSNGVEAERIAAIGKRGFLVWNKQYVIDVIEGNKKPWF